MQVVVNFTYDQMYNMVMQLSYNERMRMSRDVIRQSRKDAFHEIMLDNRPEELNEDVILAECKAARQEIYNQSMCYN